MTLADSTFTDELDVLRFVAWYRRAEAEYGGVTAWDTYRMTEALQLIGAEKIATVPLANRE